MVLEHVKGKRKRKEYFSFFYAKTGAWENAVALIPIPTHKMKRMPRDLNARLEKKRTKIYKVQNNVISRVRTLPWLSILNAAAASGAFRYSQAL